MIRVRLAVMAAFLFVLWTGPAPVCDLRKVASLPVTLDDGRPMVEGRINGHPVRAALDSGTGNEYLTRDAARRIDLAERNVPGGRVLGIGGRATFDAALLDRLELGAFTARDYDVPVLDVRDVSYDFAIGRNLLTKFDVEFDIANGTLAFYRPDNCDGVPLAYWSKDWSATEMKQWRQGRPPLWRLTVLINGVPLTAQLNTGSALSVMTLDAAERAGIRPGMPGVEPAGPAQGVGPHSIERWRATFDRFQIGDMAIQGARIMIADLWQHATPDSAPHAGRPDMLLGADFLRGHRILVSNSQQRIYFTHYGRPVFR